MEGSTSSSRIRFIAPLPRPTTTRPRKSSISFPKVAQSKGASGRRNSFDLFWEWKVLSAAASADDLPRLVQSPSQRALNAVKKVAMRIGSSASLSNLNAPEKFVYRSSPAKTSQNSSLGSYSSTSSGRSSTTESEPELDDAVV